MIQIQTYNTHQLKQQLKHQFSSDTLMQVANIELLLQRESAWSASTISELLDLKHNHLLLMLDDNQVNTQVIAYCLFSVMFETAEILRVGTHPNWQRQGKALTLIEYLMIELKTKQVENLLLEVRADNMPAINLYRQLGFKQIDCRKGYYKDDKMGGIDALIMQILLTNEEVDN